MIIKKYIFLVACLFIVFISIALAIISQNNNTPTDKIKVSVVVPVYNGEKYIKRSAKCLLNQTLKDIEIIFVNDGSTDKSAQILEELQKKHKNIKVITQDNQGAGAARDAGFREATGDYIIFFDVDDTYNRNILKFMYKKAIKTNSDIVVCSGDFNINGVNTKNLSLIDTRYLTGKEVFNYKDIPNHIFQFSISCAWNKLFKRSFLISNNIRFPRLRMGDDQYFVHTALINAERISIVNKLLITYYTSNEDSLTHKIDIYQDDAIKELQMLKEYLDSKNLYKEVEQSYATSYISTWLWVYHRISEANQPLFIDKYKKDIEKYGILNKDFSYYYNIFQYIELKELLGIK